MKASFTLTARYKVTARCDSPFRTGNAEGGADEVLRDQSGRYILQGSSIAGALRDWTQRNEPDMVNLLFGSQNRNGSLNFEDGVFEETVTERAADNARSKSEAAPQRLVPSSRPRLRIDRARGTVANKAFFETEYLQKNAKFSFFIEWLGEENERTELDTVERMLLALHQGDILLGAQKNNGFGRVTLKVSKRVYTMSDPADRRDWLNDSFAGAQPLALKAIPTADLVRFTLRANTDALLVRAKEKENNTTVNMKEAGSAVIPASSVKGAVRSRAESIAGSIGLPPDCCQEIFGFGSTKTEKGCPGKIRFEDVNLNLAKPRLQSRIRINRFTGAVMNQTLFSEESLSGELAISASVPAAYSEACLLLLFALRDLGLGMYPLGSGGAIGHGFLCGTMLKAVQGEKKLTLTFNKDGSSRLDDPDGLYEHWRKETLR